MSGIQRLTLIHSNDMHGSFLPKIKDGRESGGIARLSGYLKKARQESGNVIYANAGDFFRGSVIDSEYKGLSTIELINLLSPDIVTIGNHEVDYGLAHLLFLEKCAKFPIVNANLYIKSNHARLFEPYRIIETGGMKIMFIGVITEEVLSTTRSEPLIGAFVDVWDAASQIGAIIDNYKTTDVDLTVLLTHIGYDNDKKLAELLDPNLGVDIIIGSHSHTLLKKAKVTAGIPVVQAGSGTEHLGRFEIEIDTDAHKMLSWTWEAIDIDEDTADTDPVIESLLEVYRGETDEKYSRVVTVLKRQLSHPSRSAESELGNLFADLMQQDSSFDIMLFGAGSIRKKTLGPIVTYQDLSEAMPFHNAIYMLTVTGDQFRRMCRYYLQQSILTKGSSEFYDVSRGVKLVYDKTEDKLLECSFCGKEIEPDDRLKIALQEYHLNSFEEFFSVPLQEVEKNGKARMVVTSDFSIYDELLSSSMNLDAKVEGRITIV